MRKFTSLMLMLLCAVTTAWAQISAGSVYSIQNKNSKRAISQNASMELAVVDVANDNAQLWLVEEGGAEGTIRLRNIASGAYAQCKKQTYAIWNTDFITTDFYVGEMSAADGETPAYYYISHTAIADKTAQSYTVMHESGAKVVQWEQTNNNSQWSFVEVSDVDIDAVSEEWKAMSETKAYAKSKIESLKLATILFSVNAELGEIEAVNAENSDVASLKVAADAINSIFSTIYAKADGKSIVFDNNGNNGRAGLSVTAMDDGNAYGTASEGDETIWTLKHQGNGKYKLYNFIRNKYLNTPGTANLTDEAGAANYEFIVVDENKVALVDGTKMLHQATYWSPNYSLLDWNDLNDAASLWTITEKEIEISRELYDLANAAKTTLPYAIQQAYGLVTDASNYFSNYKSTAEGSYEALLDNVETTYFHSAYGEEPGDGTGVHYIQANLGDGNSVDEFYFYMKPRSGNGNNRPVGITVSGSNDNEVFTEIATVTTTLDRSMKPFLSEKLGTEGTKYQYIRLTVTSTNSSTTFFTLSELYFFPATEDVTTLAEAYNNLATTSITSEDYATYANTLVNAETTLALANIKKEVASILATNADNYAETPALGQYTTAAYNALNAAYTAGDATQESLEAAIAAFNKAKNVPVYFITSLHDDYAAGSAILYNGTSWKWGTANKYNKQMWMTIPAHNEEAAPVVDAYDANGTSYEICDYLTGHVMRDKKVQIVKIADWDDAYNLQYNANANSTDAAQHAKDTKDLVGWKPATTTDSKASAWAIEFLGSTYDLDQLTDEKIAALAGLQAAYNAKAFYADAEIGDGLGQYKGDKKAIETALSPAEDILSKTLAQQATLNIADINAATEALNNAAALVINKPAAGKYYRIQGACEASLKGYYITGHTNWDGGRIALTAEADASTIYYFDGTNLIAYESGLVIGLNNSHWTFASIDDNSKPASAITFAQSPRTAGAYTVKSADRYFHYTVYNNTVQVNRCEKDECKEHDWYLTEVTELPVTVTNAGYATFYAPVAVSVPSGVTAHTVTVKDGWATLSEALTVVPAETGVVLVAGEGSYNFAVTTAAAFEGTNLMAGTVAKTLVTKEDAECYVLANGAEGVGLYAAVKGEDATKFYNAGHKAYLKVENATNPAAQYSFRFGEGTTGIENVESAEAVKAIFDLTGRRVEAVTAPGIYIVNGKKVLVK